MTNGGIIEGFASEDKPRSLPKANSDLSPTTYFPNVSMRVFHGAGTNDEENAGRWTNIPDGDYLFGGSGASFITGRITPKTRHRKGGATPSPALFYFWERGLLVCKCKRRLQRLGG